MRNKSRVFKSLIVFISFVCLAMLFSANLTFNKHTYNTLNAAEIISTTEIYNDGTILSSNLWKAIKQFYNENKNEETSNRIYTNTDTGYEYFYVDIFKDFNTNFLNLSNKDIDTINNLGYLNLNSFTKINLSKNKIKTINNELAKIENLEELDLSQNEISSFLCTSLHETCYTQNLQKLFLQQNKIANCDLSKIAAGEIDATLNNITKDSLKLPDNLDVKVNLSHNLIDDPIETNTNVKYGFQGAKNNSTYTIGKQIYFNSFDDVTEISVYSLKKENDSLIEDERVAVVASGESYKFNLGLYRIKFVETASDEPMLKDIDVYICPSKPTIKMFVNGEELENISYSFTTPVTIKFYGDENARFVYYLNSEDAVEANEVEIKTPGVNIITIYQIVDEYQSLGYQLFITYKQVSPASWIYLVAGSIVFAILFYLAVRYMPKLVKAKIGENETKNKENLD